MCSKTKLQVFSKVTQQYCTVFLKKNFIILKGTLCLIKCRVFSEWGRNCYALAMTGRMEDGRWNLTQSRVFNFLLFILGFRLPLKPLHSTLRELLLKFLYHVGLLRGYATVILVKREKNPDDFGPTKCGFLICSAHLLM